LNEALDANPLQAMYHVVYGKDSIEHRTEVQLYKYIIKQEPDISITDLCHEIVELMGVCMTFFIKMVRDRFEEILEKAINHTYDYQTQCNTFPSRLAIMKILSNNDLQAYVTMYPESFKINYAFHILEEQANGTLDPPLTLGLRTAASAGSSSGGTSSTGTTSTGTSPTGSQTPSPTGSQGSKTPSTAGTSPTGSQTPSTAVSSSTGWQTPGASGGQGGLSGQGELAAPAPLGTIQDPPGFPERPCCIRAYHCTNEEQKQGRPYWSTYTKDRQGPVMDEETPDILAKLAKLQGKKYMQTYLGDTLKYIEYTDETLKADVAKGPLTPDALTPLYCQSVPVSGSQSAAVAALAAKVSTTPTPPPSSGLQTIQTFTGNRTSVVARPGQFREFPRRQRGGTRRKRTSNNRTSKKYYK
jgi:hypothetical protein